MDRAGPQLPSAIGGSQFRKPLPGGPAGSSSGDPGAANKYPEDRDASLSPPSDNSARKKPAKKNRSSKASRRADRNNNDDDDDGGGDGRRARQLVPHTQTARETIEGVAESRCSDWPVEHLAVRNSSYFYRNVRLFGRQRMRFQSVEQNKRSGQWEPRFFAVLPFETLKEATKAKFDPKFVEPPGFWADEGRLRALEMRLDSVPTQRMARKSVQRAVADRDAPPKKKYGMSDETVDRASHLQTHFTTSIVSPKFAGLGLFERLALVHRALLDELEVDQGRSTDGRTQWRGFGTVGPAVRALPQYRYIMDVEVVVVALTPHQWKPDKYDFAPGEHPYGRSRLEVRFVCVLCVRRIYYARG
jgi:stress-induced morphogen